MSEIQLRECDSCFRELALTAENFHRDATKADGYKSTCKDCRNKAGRDKENKIIDIRIRKLDEEGANLISNLLQGGSKIPHMAETYQRLLEVFGGSVGFAQHYMANYLSTSPGSAGRSRILADLLKLNVEVSKSGAAKKSLEEITDEELDLEIARTARTILLIDPEEEDDGTSE